MICDWFNDSKKIIMSNIPKRYLPLVLVLYILPLILGLVIFKSDAFAGNTQNHHLTLPLVLNKTAPASLTGRVFEIIDPTHGIQNIKVCAINFGPTCTYTDAVGTYSLHNLTSGKIILETSDDKSDENYVPLRRVISLKPGANNYSNFPLSPYIDTNGMYQVVLSWAKIEGNESVDLDANFWLPSGENAFHITLYEPINQFCPDGRWGPGNRFLWPHAQLFTDSTTGADLETIYISQLYPGLSTYAVLHAQLAGSPGSAYPSLSESNAHVDIYDSNGLVLSIPVPQSENQAATWWHVFRISDTGNLEIINEVNSDYPVNNYVCPPL